MNSELNFSLYTPESSFIKQLPVREVIVPSARGQLNILPGHAPLVSLLEAGVLYYWPLDSKERKSVAVGWGYLEINEREVSVLAEGIQTKEALDRVKTETEIKAIEERLSLPELEPKERRKLEKKLQELQSTLQL